MKLGIITDMGWLKDPGPSTDGEVPHPWRVNPAFFI